MLTVKLTYFKRSGKYYSEGSYQTNYKHNYEIYDEVRTKLNSGNLPGLVEHHSTDYLVLVEYRNGVPGLVYNLDTSTQS